jgi:YbgC/YbaW family acyl-CoA thioester hydrolase
MNDNTVFEYEVLIREMHLDSFGHVNNAAYVMLYEEARWDFISKNGFGLDYIIKHQVGPVILDLSVRFKRELLNREKILITSKVIEIVGPKIMVLEQMMINGQGKVASEAKFTIGFFDMAARKLIDANPEWLKACGVKAKSV